MNGISIFDNILVQPYLKVGILKNSFKRLFIY